jgi:hypothetical protein
MPVRSRTGALICVVSTTTISSMDAPFADQVLAVFPELGPTGAAPKAHGKLNRPRRGHDQFWATLRHYQIVSSQLSLLPMHLQLEAIFQQRLKHQPQIIVVPGAGS